MAPTATDHWSLSDDETQSKLPFDVSSTDDVFDEDEDLSDLSPLNASPLRGDEYLSPIIHRTPTMRRHARRKSESDSPQTVVYIGGGDSGSPLRYAAIQKPRIVDLSHHHQKGASKPPPTTATAQPDIDSNNLLGHFKELLTTQFVELRSTLRVELAQVRDELMAEVGEMRETMKREIAEVKHANKQGADRLQNAVKVGVEAMVAQVGESVKQESANVKLSVNKVKTEQLESTNTLTEAVRSSTTNLQDDLISTRSSLREAIDEVRISVKDDIAQLKREMSESKVELKIAVDASKAAIETEIAQLGRDTEEDKVELMNAIKAIGESVTATSDQVQQSLEEAHTDLKAEVEAATHASKEAAAKLHDEVETISTSLSTMSTNVGSVSNGKSIIDLLRSIEQSIIVSDQPFPLTEILERLSRLTSATSNLHWHSTQAHNKILAQQTDFGTTLSGAAEKHGQQHSPRHPNSDHIIRAAVEDLKAATSHNVADAISKANTMVDKALKASTTTQNDWHQRLEILIADVKRETASLSESRKAEARDLIRTIGKIDDTAMRSNKIVSAIEKKAEELKFVKDDLLLSRFDKALRRGISWIR
ncbi:uncharacterized protein AB675_10775 [Cyphellophora attinorum]|uniref:Uncharacterized protein n=1 Tax=Cyphellophora attinorum TaxID=1664694 RepID=A0A0N1H5I1_9EURO|nr:uncharacterized protein AB675_10775 [Phialophora attinorum]KPI40970.1 hypothetical protein AB675_10775 [Phialophora attinorum]